jgi:hypothetical protein
VTSHTNAEQMHNVVIIPFKCKPWAFLLDYSHQKIKNAVFLDLSKIQSLRPITRDRKRFQNRIIESSNFLNFEFGTWKSLIVALLSLPTNFRKFQRSKTILCKQSEVSLDEILDCRLAAYLGIRNFDRKDTPFFEFMRHYIVTYRTAIELDFFLKNFNLPIEKVVVYNGRDALEAACIRIADKNCLPTQIIEKGSDNSRFQVFRNSPHFHPDWWELINSHKAKPKSLELSTKAKAYLKAKLEGIDPYFGDRWMDYTNQNVEVDEFVDSNTIVYFTSSSTEFSPFSRFNYDVGYQNQYEAVESLASECLRMKNKLIIRRHPNSVGLDRVDRENPHWQHLVSKFPSDEVKYVGPFESFATYENVKKCRMVFVWKSSIGFETLALNKPTFALASAKWSWDKALRCWSKEEIKFALTHAESLVEEVRDNVVTQYANFMSQSGTKCTTFESAHKWGIILFDNSKIYNGIFENAIQKIQYKAPKFFGRRF